jgi:hypothetical protein
MAMNVKPKGAEHWYNPERDLLNVWPGTLMKAAAYAADKRSSINQWLVAGGGVSQEEATPRLREQLKRIIIVIKQGKSAKLEDILSPDLIDWPVFQAIMFAAGILLFKAYNKFYRGNRLTDANGGVQDPVGTLDEFGIMRAFDDLVEKQKLII